MEPFKEARQRLEARGDDFMHEHEDQFDRARNAVKHPLQNVEQALAHQRPDGVIGEWKNVPSHEQNVFQRIADKTHGIITPGSAVTLAGGIFSTIGLNHYRHNRPIKATLFMFIGRTLDIVDGAVAAKTETRGAPGALFDASVDKALTVGFVACAVERGDITRSEALTHAAQQMRSAVENTRLKLAGGEPNPSKSGKWGLGFLWLEAGGIVSSQAAEKLQLSEGVVRALQDATELVKHGAIVLNEKAALDYKNRRARHIASRLS